MGTIGTKVLEPIYERNGSGVWWLEPRYDGIRSGVQGGTRVSDPGYITKVKAERMS